MSNDLLVFNKAFVRDHIPVSSEIVKHKTLLSLLFRVLNVRISVMMGSTRSEKAKVENEERETAENMVCKFSIVIIMK